MERFLELIGGALGLEEPFDSHTPLISTGIIDSFDVVALLTVVESEYRVSIAPQDVDIAHFDTPAQMYSFIERARA